MTGQSRLALAAAAPVALVTLIAGVVSYSHIAALGMRTHQGWADSHLLPFAVDFLIVAGSVILLAGYWLGWLCVAAGVTGTLFANLEFGLPYGWLSAMVSTWPAVAFTVATFVLERWLRYQRRVTPAVTVPHDDTTAVTATVNGNGHSGTVTRKPTNAELADAAGVSLSTYYRQQRARNGTKESSHG